MPVFQHMYISIYEKKKPSLAKLRSSPHSRHPIIRHADLKLSVIQNKRKVQLNLTEEEVLLQAQNGTDRPDSMFPYENVSSHDVPIGEI
ncbi:hypothetical protein SprV_0501868000 [Sparganum proliferum]